MLISTVIWQKIKALLATLAVQLPLVYLVSWSLFYWYQFQSPYIPDVDGYYHIKYALLLRTQGIIKEFPWASLSLWADHFSDKEFLYHVLLIPFTYFSDLQYGAKLAAISFAALVTTSFYAVIVLNRLSFPGLWLALLFSAGGFFLFRINVPRPQSLSVTLALWSLHFVINRRLGPLTLVGLIYPLSYTGYHLPLVFALLSSTATFLKSHQLDWQLPAVAAVAMLGGMVLHPYFPDNLLLFYVQNFYILWMCLGSPLNLHMGLEFLPLNTRQMLLSPCAIGLPLILLLLCAFFKPRESDLKVLKVGLIAIAFFLLTMLVKRFAEYSFPFLLLFCAFYFQPYWESFSWRTFWSVKRRKLVATLCALTLLLTFFFINSTKQTVAMFRASPPAFQEAALYLRQHTAPEERVFTCDWDDSPQLFFFNDYNRYLVFLDPNFMYFWDPNVWQDWNKVSSGGYEQATYDILRQRFKIQYGVCTSDHAALYHVLTQDPRISIVFDDDNVFVFRLN